MIDLLMFFLTLLHLNSICALLVHDIDTFIRFKLLGTKRPCYAPTWLHLQQSAFLLLASERCLGEDLATIEAKPELNQIQLLAH